MGRYYVILPSVSYKHSREEFIAHHHAVPVPDGFHYSSDSNTEWETVESMRENIWKYVDPNFDEKQPKGKVYSIGKIIDFMSHNIISQKLFGTGPVKPQTVEHAMKDHTLHATLTYMGSPNLYLAGGGYGGSFIADLWADMGFFGIILGGLIYGICLAIIIKWCSLSFWKASVGLMMYSNIIYAPRSNYIDFIYYVFVSFTAIIVFAFIYFVKNNGRG